MTDKKYSDYIKSSWWVERRKRYMKHRARTKTLWCDVCFKQKKFHVHHLYYGNMYHENDEDLSLLCKECHREAHFLISSGKATHLNSVSKLIEFNNGGKNVPRSVIRRVKRKQQDAGHTFGRGTAPSHGPEDGWVHVKK